VRQTGFPPSGEPNGSPIVALYLNDGSPAWTKNIPYNSGDWTTWIAGVKDGKVYASRSGNGASVNAKLYCLDAASGDIMWMSVDLINAGPYDGVVFADNGDPVIASFSSIKRIRAIDGSTAWTSARVGSVGGNCGGAIFGDAIYVADAVPGGHVIKKFNLTNGAFMYQSPLMPGFTVQNSPMVGPDGTIYLSRTQNNVNTDFFYAIEDSGSALSFKWNVPANWSTSSEFAVAHDGTIYMMGPGYRVLRLDPTTGMTLNMSDPIATDSAGGNITPRMAVDAAGYVYFSNGQFSTGRFYCFNADLTERWSVAVQGINIGAPAIGDDGTLVICGTGATVLAYKGTPHCGADIAPPGGDGTVNVNDLLAVINGWGACPAPPASCDADISPAGGDGAVNVNDLLSVINAWGICP
jgi:hypothetical protein